VTWIVEVAVFTVGTVVGVIVLVFRYVSLYIRLHGDDTLPVIETVNGFETPSQIVSIAGVIVPIGRGLIVMLTKLFESLQQLDVPE
jgi:hypothetical protein